MLQFKGKCLGLSNQLKLKLFKQLEKGNCNLQEGIEKLNCTHFKKETGTKVLHRHLFLPLTAVRGAATSFQIITRTQEMTLLMQQEFGKADAGFTCNEQVNYFLKILRLGNNSHKSSH